MLDVLAELDKVRVILHFRVQAFFFNKIYSKVNDCIEIKAMESLRQELQVF